MIRAIPSTRNQPHVFLTSSRPATKTLDLFVIVFPLSCCPNVEFRRLFFIFFFLDHTRALQCMKTSAAFLRTENAVADFGSELNFPKTDGFCRKCRSSALIRF